MNCPNCGNEVFEGARFCQNCGTALNNTKSSVGATVQLRCKSCGGLMNVKEGANIIYCPYCGAAEMMVDSEDVAKEKIRYKAYTDVEKHKQETNKQVELERMKLKKEMEEHAERKESSREFKKSRLRKWVILFAIICAVITYSRIKDKNYLGAVIPGAQMLLFLGSWILGTGTSRKHNLHRLFALLGFLLIIPFFTWNLKTLPKYTWPRTGLAVNIPKPESQYGKVWSNDADYFHIEIAKCSQEQYDAYEEDCREAGFVIDQEKYSSNYKAYNDEGVKLNLSYYQYREEMDITLDAPRKMGKFSWPDTELGKLLPVPESDYGSVSWENSSGFVVYVGNTTIEQVQEYAKKCRDSGFALDYQKGDTYYRADNNEGYHVSIRYEGFNTMFVRLDVPDDEKDIAETDKTAPDQSVVSEAVREEKPAVIETPVPTATAVPSIAVEAPEQKIRTDGISPEFKNFVDSYEAFYNEYVEFLTNYDSGDFSMIAKYASLVAKAEELDKKAEAYQDDDDLTTEELNYLLNAQARIQQKLLSVS